MSKTPQILTDRATATIGDAKLFGSVVYADNVATFSGCRIQYKRPLKHPIRTIQNRLRKDKECTIVSAHGDAWSNIRFHELIEYSLSVSGSGQWTIRFSLRKCDEE